MKTIEEAIQAASACLKGVGIENSRLESEFLISAYLQMPRNNLILHRYEGLSPTKLRGLRSWISQRQKRKPLAYVSGHQPFRDLNLKVTSAVLVPRPETELLVEQALRILDGSKNTVTVVDVGTGSGNIALSLSLHSKVQLVLAIDQSKEALRVARTNAKGIQLGAPIQWIQGDLLSPLLKRQLNPQLIVANLPYVRTAEIDELEPELRWEPRMALDGGQDGLRLIEPCMKQSAQILLPGGVLLLEIGADQSHAICDHLRHAGSWGPVKVFNDFSGLPRIVEAWKKDI